MPSSSVLAPLGSQGPASLVLPLRLRRRFCVAADVCEAQRYAPLWTCLRAEQAAFESLKRGLWEQPLEQKQRFSILPNRVAQTWPGGGGGAQDDAGHSARLHAVLGIRNEALLRSLATRGVGGKRVGWRLTDERCVHIAWLDERDAHSERADLFAQGLTQPLQREFAGGVEASIRGRNVTDDRADVDNAPVALLAHHRQHGLEHAYDAEQVGVELRLRVGNAALLNRTELHIARVVDQEINPPGLCQQRLDGR